MAYRNRFVLSSVASLLSSVVVTLSILDSIPKMAGQIKLECGCNWSSWCAYCKMTINSQYYHTYSEFKFFVSRQYLKNRLMDSFQVWHVVVTGFQDVPYF